MAVLSTSYDVESSVKTTLKGTISPTQTVGIQINYALTITSGVLLFDPGTSREEFISFGGCSVSSGVTTLLDVTRGLTKTGNNFAGSGTGSQHSGGSCVVELTNYHGLYNKKANIDRSNTFTADQTIAGTSKLFFFDSNNYIFSNGTDLFLRSASQAQVSLSTLGAGAGVNDKVKVTLNDNTADYLNNQIFANNGLISSIGSPGGNETYILDIDLAVDPGLEFFANALRVRIKTAGGIVRDTNGLSIDQSASFTWTGTHNFSGATITGVEASSLVDTMVLGENVSINQPMYVSGDEKAYLASAAGQNNAFSFIGTMREAGTSGQTKKINFPGPTVPISGLNVLQGKLWPGQSNPSSNTSTVVFGVNWEGQTFTPAVGQKRVDIIDVHLTKIGAPGGSYTLDIRATDGGGLPTGAILATVSLSTSLMATGLNRFSGFNLVVTPGTKYVMILSNPGADGGNHYTWSMQNTDVLAGGNRVFSSNSGSSWTAAATTDMRFTVYYRAIAGAEVYINNSTGTLTLDPNTNSTFFQRVGLAISDTEMVLMAGEKSVYATYSASIVPGTVDTEITLGFRPKYVMAYATNGYGSIGFWHHGVVGGAGFMGDWDVNTGNAYKTEGTGFLAQCSSNPSLLNREVNLTVQATSEESITIRRNCAASATGTLNVYLAIFG